MKALKKRFEAYRVPQAQRNYWTTGALQGRMETGARSSKSVIKGSTGDTGDDKCKCYLRLVLLAFANQQIQYVHKNVYSCVPV